MISDSEAVICPRCGCAFGLEAAAIAAELAHVERFGGGVPKTPIINCPRCGMPGRPPRSATVHSAMSEPLRCVECRKDTYVKPLVRVTRLHGADLPEPRIMCSDCLGVDTEAHCPGPKYVARMD